MVKNKNDNDVVIIEGFRTPFVKSGTLFKDLHVAELGQNVFKQLAYRVNLPFDCVDELILGNVGNPPDAANLARVVALRVGLPEKISAFSVHRNCASALESITCAYNRIQSGSLDVALVGGAESMSSYPLLYSEGLTEIVFKFMRARSFSQKLQSLKGLRLKDLKPRIAILEGLTDPFVGLNMGQTAEILSKEFAISRQDQDDFALRSHQKTIQAQKDAKFSEEIVPILTNEALVEEDYGPREDQSLEKLAKLKPYFDRRYGSVTAGNACPVTDGAVALLVMSRKKASSLGFLPQAVIRSYGYAGCSPKRMGLGPVFASSIALKRADLTLKDMDLVELNEAFAAQVLACVQAFSSKKFASDNHLNGEVLGELDLEKLNVNGGAIALGHPVGATGSRLVLTLMKEMKRRKSKFGLATLCIGGGQGGSLVLENESA